MVRVWSELSKDEKAWLLRPWGSRGQRICKEKWLPAAVAGPTRAARKPARHWRQPGNIPKREVRS
jgi:hypothetical protein